MLLVFLLRVAFVRQRRNEPPLIKGWFRSVGVALCYEFDPAKTSSFHVNEKYGDIYSLGIRVQIFSDQISAIPTMYYNTKSLFDAVRKLGAIKVMKLIE